MVQAKKNARKGKNMRTTYCSDRTMEDVFCCLARDFSPTLGKAFTANLIKEVKEEGIKALHKRDSNIFASERPYFTKCRLQLLNFAKRYRCKNDVFTDDELELKGKEKFLDTQIRISKPMDVGSLEFHILQKARGICSNILGSYQESEHLELCTFGKRACDGHPYRSSYLDLKLRGPITGSVAHLQWFKTKALKNDAILQDIILESHIIRYKLLVQDDTLFMTSASLPVSFVPKSFKSLRSVKPNTLIGTFYTLGLGRVIARRLKAAGLDITRLQQKHKRLSMINSVTLKHVTADLTAASDSITTELLRRVLPSPWYRACMLGRIPWFSFPGDAKYPQRQKLYSAATMGDGHTFPLQTLVFYCLLKAIQCLFDRPGLISTYGDDLIYPRSMHKIVARVFPKLHLQLNMEKTYVSIKFRESCGGDYYRGIDVRPCSPEGEHRVRYREQHISFLYRVLNGLCRRWSEVEIPSAVEYLLGRIYALAPEGIYQVPPSFPDGSGFKVERPRSENFYSPVYYDGRNHNAVFSYFHENSDHRVVKSQYPYYWTWLQHTVLQEEEIVDTFSHFSDSTQLIWKKARKPPRFTRCVDGTKVRRLLACVALKGETYLVKQEGSVDYWA